MEKNEENPEAFEKALTLFNKAEENIEQKKYYEAIELLT